MYLCNHHVAVKSSFPVSGFGPVDVWSDFGDHRRPKCYIGNEVSIHNVLTEDLSFVNPISVASKA